SIGVTVGILPTLRSSFSYRGLTPHKSYAMTGVPKKCTRVAVGAEFSSERRPRQPGDFRRYVPKYAVTIGDHYFLSHPRLAFTVHALTTVALGYITNLIQQLWYPQSYLLLHIAVWWTASAVWLVRLANKPQPMPQPERALEHFNTQVRLHALLFGVSPSFHDAVAEQDEDYPVGTPLFRVICQSLQNWQLSSLTVSPDINAQTALFTDLKGAHISLEFDNWEFAWHIGAHEIHANETQVHEFMQQLMSAVSQVDGLTQIQWYNGGPTFHAQMSNAEIELGSDSPFAVESTGT
ncbi:MAG: hypothetical protein ABGZ53_07990, partial [Fuerstiella sp.]